MNTPSRLKQYTRVSTEERARQGFTALELLAVIATIGVLAAILLPALARSREQARRASCAVNLAQIGMAMRMYADEHERMLPWSGGKENADCLFGLYENYLPEVWTFICPSDPNGGNILSNFDESERPIPQTAWLEGDASLRGSYDYIGAYTDTALKMPHPSRPVPRIPIMWDTGSGGLLGPNTVTGSRWDIGSSNHIPGGGNVLWMDGSVDFMLAAEWAGGNLPFPVQGVSLLDPTLASTGPIPGTRGYEEYENPPQRGGGLPRPGGMRRVAAEPEPPKPELTPEEKAAKEKAAQEVLEKLKARHKEVASRTPVEEPGIAARMWKSFKRNVLYMN